MARKRISRNAPCPCVEHWRKIGLDITNLDAFSSHYSGAGEGEQQQGECCYIMCIDTVTNLKFATVLKCDEQTARRHIGYMVAYVSRKGWKGTSMHNLPAILGPLGLKWGNRNKQQQFLALLVEEGFLDVKKGHSSGHRGRIYGVGPRGHDLIPESEPEGPVILAA